ncbi:MAG: hypothetical protein U0169_01305 [Polyangiaceae bacterium]
MPSSDPTPVGPADPTSSADVRSIAAPLQVALAGTYAWAATVLPVASASSVGIAARVSGGVAVAALGVHVYATHRAATRTWIASLAAFVLASASAWLSASFGPTKIEFDTTRGIAGMIGWLLFAVADAAPSTPPRLDESRILAVVPPDERKRNPRDVFVLAFGVLAASGLQGFGWDVAPPERALLVRLVALAAGLAIVGTASHVAVSMGLPARKSAAIRAAAPSWILCGVLLAVLVLLRR